MMISRVAIINTAQAGIGTGRLSYLYRSVRLSVCRYVCLSVCPVYCGKTADWIWMPFGIVGQLGPWMRQVYLALAIAPSKGAFLWD